MVKSPPIVAFPDVVKVLEDVRLAAVTAGKLAATLAKVTPKLEPSYAIANIEALLGLVVVVNSDNFLVAIYCIVHVVVATAGTSCQSSGAITIAPSCCNKPPSSVASTYMLSSVSKYPSEVLETIVQVVINIIHNQFLLQVLCQNVYLFR
jgi:hypothetical protein